MVKIQYKFTLTFWNLLVTWCTNRFNIQQLYALSYCSYVLFIYLKTNSEIVPLTA